VGFDGIMQTGDVIEQALKLEFEGFLQLWIAFSVQLIEKVLTGLLQVTGVLLDIRGDGEDHDSDN